MMPLETLWGGIVPIGTVLPYVGKTAPLNYLLCDGSVYNKSDYPELYSLFLNTSIGITSSTFNVPNIKGRFILGYQSSTYEIGVTGGEVTHTLTVSEMPAHTHSLAMQAGNQTGLIDKISVNEFENCNWYSHVEYTGGNQPHNNMPPYIVLNYIIRAK